MRDFYLILNTIVALSLLTLGVAALMSNRKSTVNRLFLIFAISVGIWMIAACISNDTRNSAVVSLYGNYFVFFFSYLSSYLLLWFAVYLVASRRILYWLKKVSIPLLIIALISPTSLVVASVEAQGNVYAVNFGPLMILYALALFAQLFGVIFILRHGRKINRDKRKQQIQTMLYSFSIALPILLVSQFIAPALTGSFEITDAGILIMVLPVAALYSSVIRHGLFDVKLAAVRTLGYLLALFVLGLVYYALAYIISMTIFRDNSTGAFSTNPVNILLAIGLAFIFQPIKAFFDKTTDRIFYRDRYKSDEFYARLSEVLTSTTDLRTLLSRAAGEIGTTVKADQSFFFVTYGNGHYITAGTKLHRNLPTDDVAALNQHTKANGDGIIVTELIEEAHGLKHLLMSHKIALLMPLMRHDEILGYLALGEQKSTGYTNRDIKVLKTISDELIIAIQNALSVQEVRAINANLEQRIEAATAELRTSNARLKRLDASKDEFLSMASHQLRTPLTSIKGYLSMMLEGDVGKITPMQKQVLEESYSSSERMVHLIHDFLNVSRLQTGKFMLEISDVDLVKLIQEEVKSLEKVASSHSMTLNFINKTSGITMRLDDTKLRQVIMNYIDNAIYYSHPDSTITVELSTNDIEVIMEVKDTGIGVPQNEQEHLFSKFYRATNARTQRPDGTGVGIYLAKKVIVALGGDILFSSKEGKGSTFGFRLPLKQDDALLENKTKQLSDHKD